MQLISVRMLGIWINQIEQFAYVEVIGVRMGDQKIFQFAKIELEVCRLRERVRR